MERKGPAIQGTTDFGLSGHSTTITLHGHPYSNQVLLPVSSANTCIESTYPKMLTISKSSYTQRRTVSDAHYNMMVRSQCNATDLEHYSLYMEEALADGNF